MVAARDLYGDVFTLLSAELTRQGRKVAFVAVDDHAGWGAALERGRACSMSRRCRTRCCGWPTFPRWPNWPTAMAPSPWPTRPSPRPPTCAFSITVLIVVLHWATKYLNGHSDLIAGVMAGRGAQLEKVAAQATMLEGVSILLARGCSTAVSRRWPSAWTASEPARSMIAQALAEHDEVHAVAHPRLAAHPDHRLAARLLPGGSALLSFRVKGGDERALRRPGCAVGHPSGDEPGGVESLASAPYNTSHLGLSPEQLMQAGIEPGTIRLSVGVEDPTDLMNDLDRALRATA